MDGEMPPPTATAIYNWLPAQLCAEPYTIGNGHVCIVLNRCVRLAPRVAFSLWQNAKLRCTVDGGTNHWRSFIKLHAEHDASEPLALPDLITGDFDSITAETLAHFSDVPRVHTPDQSETDFTKALRVVEPIMRERELANIVIFHEHSGRFDHTMANINTLHKLQTQTTNLFLLSHISLTWLLLPGKHTIRIPADLVAKERWCALMPIGAPATNVSTAGLKWNLSQDKLEFGSMVSTSNTYVAEIVQIETNERLVWSMGVFEFDNDGEHGTPSTETLT